MKKIILLLIAFVSFSHLLYAEETTTDPVVGYWKNIAKDGETVAGYWEFLIEEGKLFAKVLYSEGVDETVLLSKCKKKPYKAHPYQGDISKTPVIGSVLMWNLSYEKEGQWGNGHIINPNDGGMFYCRVIYSGDNLSLRASMDKRGVFGATQKWVRATEEEVNALLGAAQTIN